MTPERIAARFRHLPDGGTPESARFKSSAETARDRLGWLALFMALLFTSVIGVRFLLLVSGLFDRQEIGPIFTSVVGIAVSALVYLIVTRVRLGAAGLVALGVLYECALCLWTTIVAARAEFATFGRVPELTWATPLIAVFPLVVPMPPRRALWTSLVAATMPVAGVGLLHALGEVVAGVHEYVLIAINPLFAMAIAVAAARVIHGLETDVATARHMGSYVLRRRLGEGGMGEVWLATHQMLARPAAIKLIRPAVLGDPDTARALIARFCDEARATSGLASPHTVELYDFGVSEDGAFYYVMELLDGIDLHDLVTTHGPVEPRRAVYVLRQICASLDEAHDAGMVHRDIKPANLFLCRLGKETDFVKVLDFGLVKHIGSDQAGGITRVGGILGTPDFMAPEMITGKADVDRRADIYALGCVAYWLLTGQPVFTDDTSMGVMIKHTRDVPRRPSELLGAAIPAELEALIMDCLEKAPADRPPSAAALEARLAAIRFDVPWTQEDARRWWDGRHLGTGTGEGWHQGAAGQTAPTLPVGTQAP
jgi:serine/threonine-protein kinase